MTRTEQEQSMPCSIKLDGTTSCMGFTAMFPLTNLEEA